MWYKLTRNSFENQNFTIFEETKVNRDYAINFYASSRTLINTKKHRKQLIEKRVPDLERVYEIIFQVIGEKFSCEASGLELTNSKIGDAKQILNTVENTSENSNATKTQE